MRETRHCITPLVTGLALALALAPALAPAQDGSLSPGEAEVASPPPPRVRIILNGAFWPSSALTFGDVRTFEEYVEQTTVRASYETDTAFGPELAVQATLFRGAGLFASYSHASRDMTGSVDVSRPHPLYFDRPRSVSAELAGLGYAESALHLDVAYGRGAGHLDWSLFAGITLFRVEADLLGELTYTDVYPYHELGIGSTPSTTVDSRPTGFNLGGRLDYRFGGSGRFGLGVQLLYSAATAELQATPDAPAIQLDVGGLQVGAGIRLYF